MLSLTRRNKILEILNKRNQVTTQQLEKELNVSGATIRNDLNELEKERLIKRIHGGAVLPDYNNQNSYRTFHHRSQKNVIEKKLIGKEAAKLIGDGNTIILDASSTILYLVPYFQNKEKLTIITNGLYTALEAKENNNFNVIVLGGIVRCKSGSLEGLLGINILDRINADLMFTSANGFTIQDGLTDFNFYEVELKKQMVNKAKKIIALLDHTKIGNRSAAQFANTADIDLIITDHKTKKEQIKEIQEAGIKIIVAKQ